MPTGRWQRSQSRSIPCGSIASGLPLRRGMSFSPARRRARRTRARHSASACLVSMTPRRWASMLFISRRSIRSAPATAKGGTTRSNANPANPVCLMPSETTSRASMAGATRMSRPSSERWRTSIGSLRKFASAAWRSPWILPLTAHPTIPMCMRTPSGFSNGPTARSSMPKTRPRNTRMSIR